MYYFLQVNVPADWTQDPSVITLDRSSARVATAGRMVPRVMAMGSAVVFYRATKYVEWQGLVIDPLTPILFYLGNIIVKLQTRIFSV